MSLSDHIKKITAKLILIFLIAFYSIERIIIILIISIILLTIISPIANDIIADNTAEELEDIPLPKNTQYIESASIAGKLVGNGNGMQYFGAILIKSELTLEELKSYYSDYADKEWKCRIENQVGNDIQEIYGQLKFQSEIDSEDYYIVYSWGSSDSIFSQLDLRGH